jgi:hypothetical protein
MDEWVTVPGKKNRQVQNVDSDAKFLRNQQPLKTGASEPESQVTGFLSTFKTFPCKQLSAHDFKICAGFHNTSNFQDRRRNPFQPPYYSFDESRNDSEKCYHPVIYKTQLCADYLQQRCARADFCAKAHGAIELRNPQQFSQSHSVSTAPARMFSLAAAASVSPEIFLTSKPSDAVEERVQLRQGAVAVPSFSLSWFPWNCSTCTFENPGKHVVCEVCESPKESSHHNTLTQSSRDKSTRSLSVELTARQAAFCTNKDLFLEIKKAARLNFVDIHLPLPTEPFNLRLHGPASNLADATRCVKAAMESYLSRFLQTRTFEVPSNLKDTVCGLVKMVIIVFIFVSFK